MENREVKKMANSGEVADLMVKESIQLTEAAVKMLAAGSKNLAAFLMALSQNNKKLYGKANMARLLQTGRELKTFHIKESDLEDFRAYAKKNVLFSVIKDTFHQRDRGPCDQCGLCAAGQPLPGTEELPGPAQEQEEEAPKAAPAFGPNTPHHSAGVARQPGRRGVRI
ncbi:MAG: DUF3801 domain-containing protein [Dysosmobacter welbionis]